MRTVLGQALKAPAVVAAVTLGAWLAAGNGSALLVLTIGAVALIAFHLRQLKLLDDWAAGPLGAQVPEGRGVWAQVFAALHRRMRARSAYERDLRQIIERFQQASAAIPDGIVVLDAANRIEWANARAQPQLGLDLAQDRGQPIVNLVRHPEFHRYLEAGDYGTSIVVRSQREPNRSLALQLVPFATEQKLLMSRDVTELETVARMRRDFIASVSHELKTPLTVISGFIETLEDIDVDERQRRRFLELMQEQARNMRRLVADLLTLSALESDQNPVHEEHFDVVPLLLALSNDAKALSKGAHRIDLEIRDAGTVVGSRDEIASAFGNLVTNAVRYTPPQGTIRLAWRIDDDGEGVFSVIDSGIGVAPEDIPRLTERFYRVDRSRSRATGGTGLGLAIVKHVLLRHQADLAITSDPGKGSTFAVRLPARRVAHAFASSGGVDAAINAATSSEAQRETNA